MQKRNILLCVTGGIAAYKAIDLASSLTKQGYAVKTVLTENAKRFVSPIGFAAITHNSIHSSMFEDSDPIPHISLADWADLVVVAPATANIIAKTASGIGDDLLSTLLLAHTKPVLFVPAMNVHMYEAAATVENIAKLKARGHHVLTPDKGMLACGYEGRGKYPPNQEIAYAIRTYLNYTEDLQRLKVMVTAGATIESIDPMRFISNRSSGKMGIAIARALALRGAEVCLVYANVIVPVPYFLDNAIACETAAQMLEAVMQRYESMDWIVKCAAVADYTPVNPSVKKLPKQEAALLELQSTRDILLELGKQKKPGQKLIGFAAQTDDLERHAIAKLNAKNLDLVCVNQIANAGSDSNELSLIKRSIGMLRDAESDVNAVHLSGDKFTLALQMIDQIKAL